MRNRIFIFEGCDRTGKSSFINFFKEKFIEEGYIPIVFHLMGPTKFNGLAFDNDEKSLIQLAKFNDEYDLIREMLNSDERIVIILDRSAFGEYIWTRYWNRTGEYTDYVTSKKFIERHTDLMNQTLYIDYWMSDIDALEKRILESPEDEKIFTQNNKSIKENIQYVYDMYEDLDTIIKMNNISYLKINSSSFGSLDKVNAYIQTNFNLLINFQNI